MIATNTDKRLNVTLNGQELARSGSCPVYVEDISESPTMETSTLPAGNASGLWVQNNMRSKLDVTISVYIKTHSISDRAKAFAKIAEWAAQAVNSPGKLTVSYREGQHLVCICSKPPTLPSTSSNTSRISMTFTAFSCPYWHGSAIASTTATAIAANKTAVVKINPTGTIGMIAKVDVNFQNKGADPMTAVEVITPLTRMTLSGLSIPSGKSVYIKHDVYTDVLIIVDSNGNRLAHCRTPNSDDDLLASCCAENSIKVKANTAYIYSVSMNGGVFV